MTKRAVPQWVCMNPTGVFAVVHGSEARFRVVHGNHPISVRRMRGRLRGHFFRTEGVRSPLHKPGEQVKGFLAKVVSHAMEI
jgi:hypothetical protein